VTLEDLLAAPDREPPDRTALLPAFVELTRRHLAACPAYARLVGLLAPDWAAADDLAGLPYLPVGLFKSHPRSLVSVPDAAVIDWVTSSGTTGTAVSRVALDAEAARLQVTALAAVMRRVWGPRRLPMLILDTAATLSDRAAIGARAAGVLGMMKLGAHHVFALDDRMQWREEAVRGFLERFAGQPFALFGFTFVVWSALQACPPGLDLGNGVLVHGGGWKKLADHRVDAAAFRAALAERWDLTRVHDFYGMAEQIGTIHLEDQDGLLRPPPFAQVLARSPLDFRPLPPGETGVLQVMSLLPRSYPGHSLLTEDLGVVEADGRFRVLGRLPRAELRGCSDVRAA
jgi:hypothetical protein